MCRRVRDRVDDEMLVNSSVGLDGMGEIRSGPAETGKALTVPGLHASWMYMSL